MNLNRSKALALFEGGADKVRWYDLATACYLAIEGGAPSVEDFVSGYCYAGVSELNNPNLDSMKRLNRAVYNQVKRELASGIDRQEAIRCVLDAVSRFELKPFGVESLNELVVYWEVLRAIDLAYRKSSLFATAAKRGPLNTAFRDEVGLYFAPISNPFEAVHDELGIERVGECRINDHLCGFLFYRKKPSCALPCVKAVVVDNPVQRNAVVEKDITQQDGGSPMVAVAGCEHGVNSRNARVRIGVCGLTGAPFHGFNRPDLPLSLDTVMGSSFEVNYSSDYEKWFDLLVKGALDGAIQQGCHIVVFPEAVVAPVIQQRLSDYLQHVDSSGNLALVIAGSGRLDVEEGKRNNICRMYDASGKLIGDYYKFSPFSNRDNTLVEILDDKGKECTIVDIPGIGRVLPSICRDFVSNADKYTLGLAEAFKPQIVCVPALSNSMEGAFSGHLEQLATEYLAIGCVCNLCEAAHEGVNEVCIACAPGRKKPGTSRRPDALFQRAYRDAACRKRCGKSFEAGAAHACLRVIDVSYPAQDSYPSPAMRHETARVSG